MKTARRIAREGVVQGLYSFLLGQREVGDIVTYLLATPHLNRVDRLFFENALMGVIEYRAVLDEKLRLFLDRELIEVSPIERSILWLGAYEMLYHPETPSRVIMNEAIELAKVFGGTDGHKYINGVLDKLAGSLRPLENGRSKRNNG